ncbi:MAG: winged helix-turn-helix transcriptional regulator [Leptolyngbyaceae cyanobacterium SM2_5_2]|nr:winged helix-turn-helix transcriptional regulator [Leptolyngbyaceae cyanobacterium SM2_5_2]
MADSPIASDLYCAQRLKVLAEPHRLAILKLLFRGSKHVWEINANLPIEQSLLSHHLKVLRREGFVESRRDGKAVLYQLTSHVRPSLGEGIDLGCCTVSFTPDVG